MYIYKYIHILPNTIGLKSDDFYVIILLSYFIVLCYSLLELSFLYMVSNHYCIQLIKQADCQQYTLPENEVNRQLHRG